MTSPQPGWVSAASTEKTPGERCSEFIYRAAVAKDSHNLAKFHPAIDVLRDMLARHGSSRSPTPWWDRPVRVAASISCPEEAGRRACSCTTPNFRPDAVARPRLEPPWAMAEALVFDDQCRAVAVVNRLDARFAEPIWKEPTLFVPSGTTGNEVSHLNQCNRVEEAHLGDEAVVFCHEGGGSPARGGISFNPRPTGRFGRLRPADVAPSIRPARSGYTYTERVSLETTEVPAIFRPAQPAERPRSLPTANLPPLILGRLLPFAPSAVPVEARA